MDEWYPWFRYNYELRRAARSIAPIWVFGHRLFAANHAVPNTEGERG